MRRFTPHHRRHVKTLDGIWSFAWLGDQPMASADPKAIAFDHAMIVPGCFDVQPAWLNRRGLTAYRTTFHTADTARHRLCFESVQLKARVFVDGRPVGGSDVGFTPFSCDFKPACAGEHELVVLVDNRFGDPNWLQFAGYDWRQFGGIDGPVELHRLGDCWIEDLFIQTADLGRRQIEVQLTWAGQAPASPVELAFTLDGQAIHQQALELSADQRILRYTLTLPDSVRPWSPGHPELHLLGAQLGEDDRVERFGLRQVATRGSEILLNGQPITLIGVNRHQSHPNFGSTLPIEMIWQDLGLIQQMNANCIRAAHYINSQLFLDLCDECGLLVWAEAQGWGLREIELAEERIVQASVDNVRAMVRTQRNHPSVIIWGFYNECDSHRPSTRQAFERSAQAIRELDTSRLVTYATRYPLEDLHTDLCDIICVNQYPGWGVGTLDDIERLLGQVFDHLAQAPGSQGKPMMISEIGCEALKGWQDAGDARWSEAYQARLLTAACRYALEKRRDLCGFLIWQFSDTLTSILPPMSVMRPRGFNNKGIVDEYRRPKAAWHAMREWFAIHRQAGEAK